MPAPIIIAAIGRGLAALAAGAGRVAAGAGARAAAGAGTRVAAGAGTRVAAGEASAGVRAARYAAYQAERGGAATIQAGASRASQARAAGFKFSAQPVVGQASRQAAFGPTLGAAGVAPGGYGVSSAALQRAVQGQSFTKANVVRQGASQVTAAQGAASQATQAATGASNSVSTMASNVQSMFQKSTQLLNRMMTGQSVTQGQTQSAIQRLANLIGGGFGGGGGSSSGGGSGGGALPPGSPPPSGSPGGGGFDMDKWIRRGAYAATTGVAFSGGGGPNTFKGLAGAAAGAIPRNVIGAAMGNPFSLARMNIELAMMPNRLKDFGAGLVESQQNLVGYSGTMAAATMQLRGERIRRDVRVAGLTGGSLSDLSRTQSRMEDRLLPYVAAYRNTLNRAVQIALNIADVGLTVVEMLSPINEWAKWAMGKEDKTLDANAMIKDYMRKIVENTGSGREIPPLGGA